MSARYRTTTRSFDSNHRQAMLYHYRGIAYEEMGKTKEAERDFAKAKELGFDF